MKKLLIIVLAALVVGTNARADEGMWLLPYLQKLNYADMKAKGLKLSATDIYNPNGTSLMDAIVIFGGGCTGEIVSPDGLIFTNHHCGYGAIQALSSVENDYLGDGFWAMNRSEELPAGISVTFIRSFEDVTAKVTAGIPANYTEEQRREIIDNNSTKLRKELEEQNPGKRVQVSSLFGGNEFFAVISEVYRDVRLVGTPPSSIGKYGGDTDNWMWPRHTGDFSIFRVYSAPDGSPAEYSKDNVPYRSPKHLKVSAKGYQEGDFAMIMGFPGSTNRYMTTYEIDEFLNISAPNRIFIRGERQDIIWEDMEASDKVRIQYASKYAGSSNYWKNSIGMSQALRKLKIRDKKLAQENEFKRWAAANPSRARYATALPLMERAKAETSVVQGHAQYLTETIMTPFEISRIANSAARSLAKYDEMTPEQLKTLSENLYKNYNEPTERKVAKRMLEILVQGVPRDIYPEFVNTYLYGMFDGDIDRYVDWLFNTSVFANRETFDAFLADFDADKMAADPAMSIISSTTAKVQELRSKLVEANGKFSEGHRLYVAGLLEMNPNAKYYPDANFTMRVTYGNILPYSPADAVDYNYYTTLKGVIEKEDPTNPLEFTVPDRLKDLYYADDYGRYADYTGLTKKEIKNGAKGHLNTCFISNNDITGGNSGSPVLNGNGELIGLAFDGNWEAMSGDILFEPELQRCINVDVRYVLWVIDKFAGAGHLLNEMSIVW